METTKRYVLSSDIGKFETEMIGREVNATVEDLQKESFRTNMHDLSISHMDVEGNSHKIEFEGEEYVIGEQAPQDYTGTSKTNLLHKLSCYTAITRFLEPETKGNEINMVLACPLSVLKIQAAKEEYKNYIKGDGEIHVVVDDKNYHFTITEIMIKAEGSGILYTEPKLFEGLSTLIVDLGGLNMGLSLYRNKACKNEDRHIEECGTDKLISFVKEQGSIYDNGNVMDDDDATKALHDVGIKVGGAIDPKSVEYINRAKVNYFNEILRNIKKYKINIDRLDKVVFVGGTTQHIKDVIQKEIAHSYIPNNSQWSTVEGLYKVAIKKYGK